MHNKHIIKTYSLFSQLLRLCVYVIICSLFLFSIPASVDAVTVGPVKIEYDIDPGSVITGEIYIKNEEAVEKTFYPYVETFTEQNGQKVFPKEPSLIGAWFKTQDSVTLKPGEGIKIPYTLTVPKDAPPGGQFAVIWWGNVPPKTNLTEQEVSIQTRAGILVYINISGNTIEKASVDFSTLENRVVFPNTTVPFSLNIKNEGNVYIKPTGSLKVTSIFGKQVAELPVNAKQLQILPKSFRMYDNLVWYGSGFSFGPYKTELTVLYGKQSAPVVISKWIWIFPIKLIVISLTIIIVLSIIMIMFFKMYNRWLLKQFKLHNSRELDADDSEERGTRKK